MIVLYAEVERRAHTGELDVEGDVYTVGPFRPEEGLEDDPALAEEVLQQNLEAQGELVLRAWSVES